MKTALLILTLALPLSAAGIRKYYVSTGAGGTASCNETANTCTGYAHTMAGLIEAATAAAAHQDAAGAACQPEMVIMDGEVAGSFVYPAKSQEFDATTGARKAEANICRQPVYMVSSNLGKLAPGTAPSSSDAANLATLTSTDATGAVAVISNSNLETAYWHWIGWQVQPMATTPASQILVMHGNVPDHYNKIPHHITFEKMYIHGFAGQPGPRIGMYFQARNITIIDTRVEEIHTVATNSQESQGILIGGGHTYDLRNVVISAASQNFFPVSPGLKPFHNQHINVRGMHLWRPYLWKITASTSDVTTGAACNFPDSWHRNTSSGRHWQCQGALGSSTWADLGTGTFSGPNYIIKPSLEIKLTRRLDVEALVMERGWVPNNPSVGAWDGQAHNFILTNQSTSATGTSCTFQTNVRANGGRFWARADFVNFRFIKGDRGHSASNIASSNPPSSTGGCGYTDSGWATPGSWYTMKHALFTNMNPADPSNGVASSIGGRLTGWTFGGQHHFSNITLTLADGSSTGQMITLSDTYALDKPVSLRNSLASIGSSSITGYTAATFNGSRQICQGDHGNGGNYSYVFTNNVFTRETSTSIAVHADPCGSGVRMFPGNTIQLPTTGTAAPTSWQAYLDSGDYSALGGTPLGDDDLPIGPDIDMLNWHINGVTSGTAGQNEYLNRFSIQPVGAGRGLYIVKPTKAAATIVVDDTSDFSSPVYNAADPGTSTEVSLNAATLNLGSTKKRFFVKVTLSGGQYKTAEYYNF
jgi:hypothetical protein